MSCLQVLHSPSLLDQFHVSLRKKCHLFSPIRLLLLQADTTDISDLRVSDNLHRNMCVCACVCMYMYVCIHVHNIASRTRDPVDD